VVWIVEVIEDDAGRGFWITAAQPHRPARTRLHHHPGDDEAVRRDRRPRPLARERTEYVQVFLTARAVERHAGHDARGQALIDLVGIPRGCEQPERGVVVKVVTHR